MAFSKPLPVLFYLCLNFYRMNFLKKNWSNLLFIMLILILILPQTRKPVQVQVNRIFAFSPSEISAENREKLQNYHWNLDELESGRKNLNSSEGKVTVVNLWATWCPPCIAEMSSFQKLYNDYSEKMDFYFVSSEEPQKLKNFLQKHDYNLPVFRPLSAAPVALQSNSLPTTYVISKSGEILIEKTGTADWNDGDFRKKLDEWIGEE